MPEDFEDISDQAIINIESYVMSTNAPNDILINLAKLMREVRRRRFEQITRELND